MKKLLLLVLILFGFISTSFAEYELTTSKNQIILEIVRQVEDYSSNLFLYIHYLDPTHAEVFLKENRPVIVSEDDF